MWRIILDFGLKRRDNSRIGVLYKKLFLITVFPVWLELVITFPNSCGSLLLRRNPADTTGITARSNHSYLLFQSVFVPDMRFQGTQLLAFAATVHAHGYMVQPMSRTGLNAQVSNTSLHCPKTRYVPTTLLFPKHSLYQF